MAASFELSKGAVMSGLSQLRLPKENMFTGRPRSTITIMPGSSGSQMATRTTIIRTMPTGLGACGE